ncbi:OFA family MFS transporter [Bradyrhizobium sp. HKCCYLS2038]|uniref:OFA family MFS transporter n=1 Tax=unclassified Bradyrhizobium TaxID=2631580 RepID=UPI003EB7887F
MTVVSTTERITRKGRRGGCVLARRRTIAAAGFNRWLVPPAALCIQLCIGMSYGLSVFWLPLSRAIGIDKPVACASHSLLSDLFTTSCDWQVTNLLTIFTTGLVMLGFSAALFGGWLERAGPRKAGAATACCWGGGFIIAALGVHVHQFWIMWIGLGLIGGTGLGLGYIAPLSILVKWFPDRRGLTTGLAIMGFGGGAAIGAPLATRLIDAFKTPTSIGVAETFLVLGVVYFVVMLIGAFALRIPPTRWQPPGASAPSDAMISTGNVHFESAHETPQFWLLWIVLCMNVLAGIGVLALTLPMLLDLLGGALIGRPEIAFSALDDAQRTRVAAIATGYAGLLSLFNIAGRLFWAALSDRIGRKPIFSIMLILGVLLCAAAPSLAHMGSPLPFAGALGLILALYGGSFATMPAYVADLFGPKFVGAIHGRLLTAWSTAGLAGPLLVGYLRNAQLQAGVERAMVYDRTMYVLASFLVVGLIANLLVKPLADKGHLAGNDAAQQRARAESSAGKLHQATFGIGRGGLAPKVAAFWVLVGIPLVWGLAMTLQTAVRMF